MSVAGRASIVGAAATHVGKVRDHNEDAHFFDPELGIFLVCDGMGGHAAGEVASALAIREICQAWRSDRLRTVSEEWLERGTPEARKQLIEVVRAGVIAAHRAIVAEAERDDAKSGMGTTLVGAMIVGGELVFAHAGDSRAYLVRDGISMQLTEDHTLLARLLAAGIDVDVTGEGSRFRSMLTNALGIGEQCKVSTFVVPLADGDRILLCSDGISEYVPENEVGEVLTKQQSPARAAQRLIDLALERGGGDNATAIVVRVLEAGETPLPAEQRRKDDAAIGACALWGRRVTPQQRLRALRIAIPRDHGFGDKLPAHALGDRVAWIIVDGELVQDGQSLGPGALVYPESLVLGGEPAPPPDRDAMAITRTDVRALAIRAEDFRELCDDDGELGEALLESLAQVVARKKPRAPTRDTAPGSGAGVGAAPGLHAVPAGEVADAYRPTDPNLGVAAESLHRERAPSLLEEETTRRGTAAALSEAAALRVTAPKLSEEETTRRGTAPKAVVLEAEPMRGDPAPRAVVLDDEPTRQGPAPRAMVLEDEPTRQGPAPRAMVLEDEPTRQGPAPRAMVLEAEPMRQDPAPRTTELEDESMRHGPAPALLEEETTRRGVAPRLSGEETTRRGTAPKAVAREDVATRQGAAPAPRDDESTRRGPAPAPAARWQAGESAVIAPVDVRPSAAPLAVAPARPSPPLPMPARAVATPPRAVPTTMPPPVRGEAPRSGSTTMPPPVRGEAPRSGSTTMPPPVRAEAPRSASTTPAPAVHVVARRSGSTTTPPPVRAEAPRSASTTPAPAVRVVAPRSGSTTTPPPVRAQAPRSTSTTPAPAVRAAAPRSGATTTPPPERAEAPRARRSTIDPAAPTMPPPIGNERGMSPSEVISMGTAAARRAAGAAGAGEVRTTERPSAPGLRGRVDHGASAGSGVAVSSGQAARADVAAASLAHAITQPVAVHAPVVAPRPQRRPSAPLPLPAPVDAAEVGAPSERRGRRPPSEPEIETYFEIEADEPPEAGDDVDVESELALSIALSGDLDAPSASMALDEDVTQVMATEVALADVGFMPGDHTLVDQRRRAITAEDGSAVSGTISIPEGIAPPSRRAKRLGEGRDD